MRESVADHPLVAATLANFPDAKIRDVRRIGLGQIDYSGEMGDDISDDFDKPDKGEG